MGESRLSKGAARSNLIRKAPYGHSGRRTRTWNWDTWESNSRRLEPLELLDSKVGDADRLSLTLSLQLKHRVPYHSYSVPIKHRHNFGGEWGWS